MKIYNILKNISKKVAKAFSHSDSNLQNAKDYTDSLFEDIGTYTDVTGTLVTKSWNNDQNCVKWYAPQDGIYLMSMSMYPVTDQQMANAYKQFRWYGSVTAIHKDLTALYWLGSSSQGLCGCQWSFPVKATAGQWVSGYIWTSTVNVKFNVRISGVLIAKVGGVVLNYITHSLKGGCVA